MAARYSGRHRLAQIGRSPLLLAAFALIAVLAVVLPLTLTGHASATMAQRKIVALRWAEAQAGKPYIWGGNGPVGFDCSGLVVAAWRHAGISLPRTVAEIIASGRLVRVSRANRSRGDLVTWGTGHIEFVTRHQSFGAHHTGTLIGWRPLYGTPEFWEVR